MPKLSSNSQWWTLGLCVVVSACGGATTKDAGGTKSDLGRGGSASSSVAGSGSSSVVPRESSAGASVGPSSVAASAGSGGKGFDAGAATCGVPERASREPGPAVTELAARGKGACAAKSLGDVIAAVRTAHPEFADIKDLYTPDPMHASAPSSVYAFETKDDGFAVVFRRGSVDCLAGCIANEYWYFRTDASCDPQSVGHFLGHADPSGCFSVEGFPLWDHPQPLDPASQCGDVEVAGLSPLGDYSEHACGQLQLCTDKGSPGQARDFELQFKIDTVPGSGQITLTLQNTGELDIDNRPLTATVQSQKVHVVEHVDNLPSKCLEQHDLEVMIDFGGHQKSFVHYEEVKTRDCTNAPDNYCKGSLQLELWYLSSSSCTAAMDLYQVVATILAQPQSCQDDGDCTLINLGASCAGGCPAAVRTDQADDISQLFRQAADAYCKDVECRDGPVSCPAQHAVCQAGSCTTELGSR
jgi:hypothetical protein